MAATMKDLSRETGLGLATISKYFNGGNVREKNRVLIEAAVRKLHYVPNEVARSLKTQHSRVIGVVIPELSNAFITSIISTMEDILRKHDYAVIVCDCRSDEKREKEAVEFLMHRRVDGLINMATDTSGAHLKGALSAGIPVLLIDRLIDSLLGSPDLFTTNERLNGYLDALREAGITPSDQYIRYGDYTMDGGYQAVLDLLSLKERPTALFVTNFEMTLGAMLALQRSGVRIPEDLSVIGFDKLELFGEIFPDLTLIRQPQLSIGREAASLMLDLVGSGDNVSHRIVTLSTELAEGTSVRALKP